MAVDGTGGVGFADRFRVSRAAGSAIPVSALVRRVVASGIADPARSTLGCFAESEFRQLCGTHQDRPANRVTG